jgi:TetR/AcrR family transcriptional repressor of mexJK operon
MTNGMGTSGPSERPGPRPEKRRAITDAATRVFLRNGYAGTSVDEIAALAGVSKQTVYKHFDDKEGLFTAVLLETIDQVGGRFYEGLGSLETSGDVERTLREVARELITVVMQPELIQLRRLVTAEAERFPTLGRAYYERGPEQTVMALTSSFRKLARRGLLHASDVPTAARHFVWLVVSIPLNEAMLTGEGHRPADKELRRLADAAVRAFLRGYGA